MDFSKVSLFGSYIAKEYSRDLLRLLVKYSDISSSEAASRLNLHIKTAQDFLEGMAEAGILVRVQVTDKKRPYYRYSLENSFIEIKLDLNELAESDRNDTESTTKKIRERNNSGASFTTARYDSYFSSVTIRQGESRNRSERRISLTNPQGRFLYNLPFPGAEAKPVKQLMIESGLNDEHLDEITDILELLSEYNVIEYII